MQNLHRIPKEKTIPALTSREKRGIQYLYAIGYRYFKRTGEHVRNGAIFSISEHPSGTRPLTNIYASTYSIYGIPAGTPEFIYDWITI